MNTLRGCPCKCNLTEDAYVYTDVSNEVWNYGDGSPGDTVKSEKVSRQQNTKGKFAHTVHSFSKPGHYIVTVERSNEYGFNAIGHLHVVVNE